jgi:methylenetetrahydrofolate dehydrogenase (NADP+)/methenyltetrahydrofolate cyclohydrolase
MTADAGAAIIDGKAIATDLLRSLADQVKALLAGGLVPGLAVVLVGDDAASEVYVRNKSRAAAKVGIASVLHRLPQSATQSELDRLIGVLNRDPGVHGILVQFPLPEHLDAHAVIGSIDPAKDVDGLSPTNAGRLASGLDAPIPCTPQGCLMLIKSVRDDLAGLDALVIGRSNLVGKPVAQLLLAENCTVTIGHSHSIDLGACARRADILVVAAGRPRFVPGDWIRPGAIVIDVGINRIAAPELGAGRTRLVGDVDFVAARWLARAITPVPGGVGPMTVACLMRNTLQAVRRQSGLPA